MVDKQKLIYLYLSGNECTYEDFLSVLTPDFRAEFIGAQLCSGRKIGHIQEPVPFKQMHSYFHNIHWREVPGTKGAWYQKMERFEKELKKFI